MFDRHEIRLLAAAILFIASSVNAATKPTAVPAAQLQSDTDTPREKRTRVIVALREPQDSVAGAGAALQMRTDAIRDLQDRVLQRTISGLELYARWTAVPGFAALVTEEQRQRLEADPEVVRVDDDVEVRATLGQSVPLIGGNTVRGAGWTGSGVTVAVIDSGIARNHAELPGAVVAEACFCSNASGGCCPNGSTVQTGTGAAADDHGHGTHVAGIIAARGIGSSPGVAPAASLVAVKVLDSSGRTSTTEMVSALDWIINNRPDVDVVNMSLGTDVRFAGACNNATSWTISLANAINTLVNRGTVVVVASGNDADGAAMSAPACIQNALAVGAVYDAALGSQSWAAGCTDSSTAADQIVCFSNASSALDLLAPGSAIVSLSRFGGTVSNNGTSMAAPHVAGAAAVLMQRQPSITPAQIETTLESTGVPRFDSRNGSTYPRINLLAAVNSLGGSCFSLSTAVSPGGVGGSVSVGTSQNCSGGYTSGTAIQLMANAPAGYSFSNWSTSGGGSFGNTSSSSTTFTISGNATVTANFVSGGSGSQLIVNGGFESATSTGNSAPGWTVQPAVDHVLIQQGGAYPHSGTAYAYLGAGNNSVDIIKQTITIPNNASAANFKFWVNIVTTEAIGGGAFDALYVDFYNTNGTWVRNLAAFSNEDAPLTSNTNGVYVQVGPIDVSAQKGLTLQVVFEADMDVSLPTTFRIDDVSLEVATSNETPSVTISSPDPNAREAGPNTATFTFSRTGSLAQSLTVNYTIGGSATNGSDYNSLPASATIAAGQASQTITLTPIDDALLENPETVTLTIAAGSYNIGSPNSASATIADNDGNITVQATDATASESGSNSGTFTFTRTGSVNEALTVSYTLGGSATNGSDYSTLPGTVVIPGSSASVNVVVNPVADGFTESPESVVLTIGTSINYKVGSPSAATVTISDSISAVLGDLNGDGKVDQVIRNSTNGDIGVWLLNGTSIITGAVAGQAAAFSAVGLGDTDADGKSDILLRNNTNGDIGLWKMNGVTIAAGAVVGTPGLGWTAIATADLNGDGRRDIVIQNLSNGDIGAWLMNGFAQTAGAVVGSPGTTDWQPVATGDFNRDGKTDIVVRNSSTGVVGVWHMNGLTVTSGVVIGTPGTIWTVAAVADLDGNGWVDLIIRNSTNGDVGGWLLNGTSMTSAAVIGTPGTGWTVAGTADFNQDGKADIIVRQTATGNLGWWQMNGLTLTTAGTYGTPGPNWQPVWNR
jgi:subtilisin family serine protease